MPDLAAIQVSYQHLEARRALHNDPSHDHQLVEQVEEDHDRHIHELEVAWWRH